MADRKTGIAALVLPLLLAMTSFSEASLVCERLTARLGNLPQITSNEKADAPDRSLRDDTGAIARANIDLRRARNERRRLGCSTGSVIVVGGPNAQACDSLIATIARMDADLEALKARRRPLVSGDDSDIDRRRILAALELNRCADERDTLINTATSEPDVHRNILKGVPSAGENLPMLRGSNDIIGLGVGQADVTGNLRTLCVRMCDGAFFPISSNATPADFGRDAQACSRRCPGADTELYYHALATEETDQMISAITGTPYTNLPAAFAYRTRDLDQPAACGCRAASLAAAGTANGSAAGQKTPDDGGSITPMTTQQASTKALATGKVIEERPYDPLNARVRIVGPTFLPPQESAIDLRHPTGPGYQPVQSN